MVILVVMARPTLASATATTTPRPPRLSHLEHSSTQTWQDMGRMAPLINRVLVDCSGLYQTVLGVQIYSHVCSIRWRGEGV